MTLEELEAQFHRIRGRNETLPWGCGLSVAQARRLVREGICVWVDEPKYTLNIRRWEWRIKLSEEPREQPETRKSHQR